ncbi:MAG: DNA mismatch repair endonuclease MutL [Bacilli bacterium]|nr:DNA mismatch repair endonuclease MutL [Bacilli bacterium]
MSKIMVMDEILANKIAAGEVVEKCASVVKELVENSIDAGSNEIKIELIDAGTKQIRIMDNGSGMDREDAILAFSRHATSKLKTEDDLYRIETLGFRGEALASIASVSKIELKTSTGCVGTSVIINGGKIESVNESDSRVGTAITVSDLFYNTPARLKHLKSLYTELANITEYVNKMALSHPEIKFILINNGNTILNTDGSGNLLKTISSIFGINIVKKMVEVTSEDNDYIVSGFITLPEVMRSSRNGIITLVNGRVVRNVDINRIINDSYHGYKPDNRYPIVVLNIEVDPSLVDVNIHPTKMDIKFGKMDELLSLIENMIKKTLKKQMLIPHIEVSSNTNFIGFDVKDSIEDKVEMEKPKYEEITLDLERVGEEETIYSPSNLENNNDLNEKSTQKLVIEDENRLFDIEESTEKLPELYPVGLVHGTYIICQNERGMYLIDQHAAKERINYEYYREKLGNPKPDSISMLIPLTIEFPNNEYMILKENFLILENMGFEIDEFGVNSIVIKAHPTWIPIGNEDKAINLILDLVINKEKDFSLAKFNEHVAATVSCKASIKANENITLEEMENLISDLRKCKNPFNCPHGRPTMIYYSKYDLEKLFKRSGF